MKGLLLVALMVLVSLVEMAMSRLSRYLARTPPQTAPGLRRSSFAILILFVGCSTVGAAPLTLPTGLSPVVDGIADQGPYFGKFKAPDNSEGDFLLASCGCGDWRVLMSTADGKQWQFPVRFYSIENYRPTGDVTVFGQTDAEVLLGTVHQDAGLTDGLSYHNTIALNFSATRGETHTNDASSCVKCHIGDNPIRPQAPDHPSGCAGGVTTACFTVDPPNCLSCHTVVIKTSNIISLEQAVGVEKKGEYLLPGDIKTGWKVFITKKCSTCHSIWGEGGKKGPDLGTLPESYVTQSQFAALIWNHWPGMLRKMAAKKIPPQKMDKTEMADLFAFLYFIRYMDEPGNPQIGKMLLETKHCSKCHPVLKGETKGDLSPWGMNINATLWAQMMWNHVPQMEQEMKKKGLPLVEFKGNEMADIIADTRSLSSKIEKVNLSPGNLQSGKKLFTQKGCIECHSLQGELDLSKRKDFPRTLAQLTGMMWNHSFKMLEGMKEKGMEYPTFSPQEMADLAAYLFSTKYFDEPGDPEKGKDVFTKKQCNLCHAKGTKIPSLSGLKGQISPIFMAQGMWNHGPEMLEKMRKAKVPWTKIDVKEMADLMEYLNQGMP